MDRPNLPPLRLALSGSLDDFDRHQMHLISNEPTQARRHRNPTLLADLGPRLPPLIGHPPIRPGDLSIYSLGSSAGSASSAHGNSASSRNSIPFHEPTTNVHQPPRFPGVPDQARHHAGSFNVHPSSLGEVRHRRGSIGTLYNPSYHNLAFDQADRNQESGFRQLDNHHHAFPQSVRLSSSVGRVDQPISHRRPSFGMSGSPHVSPVCLNSGYAGGSPINPGSRRSPDRVPSQSSNSSESFRRGNVQALINRPEPTPQAAPRWVCDYEGCGKTFTRGFNLTQHKAAIHRDERRFECSYCSATFYRRNDLSRHERSHTGERPYKCECGESFTRTDLLTRHKQYGNCSYYSF